MRCAICDTADVEFACPWEPDSATRGLCYDCYEDEVGFP